MLAMIRAMVLEDDCGCRAEDELEEDRNSKQRDKLGVFEELARS